MGTEGNNPKKLTGKERMAIERQSMPERDPRERATDFEEVNLGLPEEIAVLEAQRCLRAMATSWAGGMACPPMSRPSRGAWDICQFWQNAQRKLHPAAATERLVVPGRKWNSGFFSIGSMLADTRAS